MGVLGELISKSVTGAAGSVAGRVSPLSHKAGDNTVESEAVIESLTGEKDEIVNCYRNITGE